MLVEGGRERVKGSDPTLNQMGMIVGKATVGSGM